MTARGRWIVLAILSLVYVCNVADRLVLSILAQDIKMDLKLSDLEVGLLVGPAIAFLYAATGIPMAYVADRVHRVRFLAICLSLWSLLTALGGMAGSALQLGLARIGVSAAEAGGSPTASSLIADYFPPRQRATAMGLYSSASTVGVLVSFGLGGLIGAAYGWRWALFAAGVPGVVLALLLLAAVKEPVRGAQDKDGFGGTPGPPTPRSLTANFKTLWRNGFYREVVLAAGVSNFCFHAVLNWGPSLIQRKLHVGTGHAGVSLGIGIALFGGVASIVGGRITSGLSDRGVSRPMRIAAVLQFLSAPLMLAAVLTPRFDLTLVLMCAAYGFQSFFIPIYWSVSQSHVPPDVRAMAAAVLLLSIAVIGPGLSAPIIGAISDALKPSYGNGSLQHALALTTSVNLLTAFLFWHASVSARRLETNAG